MLGRRPDRGAAGENGRGGQQEKLHGGPGGYHCGRRPVPGDDDMTADAGARLANRILIGLVIGALAGGVTLLLGDLSPALLEAAREFATLVLDPIGQVFLRMLFFVVIPLVFASLAMGVAQLEHLSSLGPLAVRTFVLFFLNMAIAATLGLVMMNVIEPGAALAPEARAQLL